MAVKTIIHVIPFFQPQYGYEETFHAAAHADQGHEVHVICSKFYNPNVTNNCLRVVDRAADDYFPQLTIHRLNSIFFPLQIRQCFLIDLLGLLRKFNPDVIFMHGPEYVTYFPIMFYKTGKCVKIIDVHKSGVQPYKTRPSFFRLIKSLFRVGVTKLNLSFVDHALFYSETHRVSYMKQNLLNSYYASYHPMPYDSSAFFYNRSSKYNSTTKNLKSVNLVLSGRLVPEKHILEIVVLFLKNYHSECQIYLVGEIESDYQDKILSSFSFHRRSSLIFLPSQNRHDLAQIYNKCDVGLWLEHYSVGILEAMACGVSVFTNSYAKDYYPVIPECRVLDGNTEEKISELIYFLSMNLENLKSDDTRMFNSGLVAGYTYESLATFTSNMGLK